MWCNKLLNFTPPSKFTLGVRILWIFWMRTNSKHIFPWSVLCLSRLPDTATGRDAQGLNSYLLYSLTVTSITYRAKYYCNLDIICSHRMGFSQFFSPSWEALSQLSLVISLDTQRQSIFLVRLYWQNTVSL